jgi:hypothetical protein
MVFIKPGVAIGGSVGRMEARSYYHSPAHRNNNYVKCDETAKKRDELVTGAVFRVEKAGRENTALTEAPSRGGRRVAGLRFRSSLLYEGCSYILLG